MKALHSLLIFLALVATGEVAQAQGSRVVGTNGADQLQTAGANSVRDSPGLNVDGVRDTIDALDGSFNRVYAGREDVIQADPTDQIIIKEKKGPFGKIVFQGTYLEYLVWNSGGKLKWVHGRIRTAALGGNLREGLRLCVEDLVLAYEALADASVPEVDLVDFFDVHSLLGAPPCPVCDDEVATSYPEYDLWLTDGEGGVDDEFLLSFIEDQPVLSWDEFEEFFEHLVAGMDSLINLGTCEGF